LAESNKRASRISKLSVIIGINQSPIPNSIQKRAKAIPVVWIGWLVHGFSKMLSLFAFTLHLQPNPDLQVRSVYDFTLAGIFSDWPGLSAVRENDELRVNRKCPNRTKAIEEIRDARQRGDKYCIIWNQQMVVKIAHAIILLY
jgi:hypothetical protein